MQYGKTTMKESTLSSLNTVNINKKSVLTFSTSFTVSEDSKIDKFSGRKTEKKEFSIHKSLTALVISVIVYYAVSVFFGAPAFEVYSDTLYFSVLMTLLTVYPLIWYYFFCDNLLPVLKILSDSKEGFCAILIVAALHQMELQHINFCTIQSIAKLPTCSPKTMSTWLYRQYFAMLLLNRH
ncbi:phosphatidylinositol-glycan biosynthesis class F protein [Trichonephila clavipes]|nr:phosphatidylinositol-glycan biosynthesis class F protein [Trichonephila clavipes]